MLTLPIDTENICALVVREGRMLNLKFVAVVMSSAYDDGLNKGFARDFNNVLKSFFLVCIYLETIHI